MPPLRERHGDVRLLIDHFFARFNNELGKTLPGLSDEAITTLENYGWPGNVRELRNLIERLVILEGDREGVIQASSLPPEIRFKAPEERKLDEPPDTQEEVKKVSSTSGSQSVFELPASGIDLEEVERAFIVQALDMSGGTRAKAARLLGISRHALRYRMQKFNLE